MKFQIPNSKFQINSKSKNPNTKRVWKFSNWNLRFVWDLVLGIWSLDPLVRGKGGYSALITTLITVFVSLTVVGGLTFFSLKEVSVNRIFTKSVESRFISEGGIEDAAYRLVTGKQISSGEQVGVGKGTTTITIISNGNQRIIRSEGRRENVQQNLEMQLNITTAATNFYYGVQVGDGGMSMANNSLVDGSVYSNGSITGGTGATITGDAFVAAPQPPYLGESWTTQNSDYSVGTSAGAVVTLVDSAGDVGSYNSIALGSDGFARIAYYDATNDDLKYARCLNSDCSLRNIAVVDSAGDVGWRYTSIALGSDGFARISYYDVSGKDLKFVRCLNDDCTSKNISVVESSGDKGQFSHLVLGSDGFARISYYAISGGDLKFARCLDADCSSKNISSVDTSGDVGKYTSVVLGSDGFARISYLDETNDDLKFARCTNADCTSSNRTTVDSSGDMGSLKTSIAMGSDGFARIVYYDDTNDDLRLARCTNDDCTSKVLTTVDSSGNVGKYMSMRLGSDGFARISYYGSGNLRFARCTNDDCASKVTSDPDNTSNDLGHYTSLALGGSDFGRISHYDDTVGDLRFVLCADADCNPPNPQIDLAQSFQPTTTERIVNAELFFKKVGSPANATLRLIRDSSGSPSTNPVDVLTTGTINASAVSGAYAWLSIAFSSTPTLSANTTYWLVLDASFDNSNYFVWGGDSGAGYTRGSAKRASDWQSGGWIVMSQDLDFRVYIGGVDTSLEDVAVGAKAHAHLIDTVTVGGNADAYTLTNSTVNGNAHANAISNCVINGNAEYNTATSCTILGTQTTPTTPPVDPARLNMPIPAAVIQGWKTDASLGGTCIQPECDASGDYILTNGQSGTLGPKKITGKLKLDNNAILTVSGTLWVVGNVELSNGCTIRLSPSFGALSGVIITDSIVSISNNCTFQGSGNPASYVMLMSEKDAPTSEIMTVDNNSAGVIYYADNGRIKFSNNATAKEATAYGITMDNNAVITYESGLANVNFSSGPAGGYDVIHWKKVE